MPKTIQEIRTLSRDGKDLRKKLNKTIALIIVEMVGNGHTISYVCEKLGFSRMTEWRYRQQNAWYRIELERVLNQRVEMVEESLYAKAVGGDVSAQKFWLTNRSAGRWKSEQYHNIGGQVDGEPMNIKVKEIIVRKTVSADVDEGDDD